MSNNPFSLEKKTILITGASSGIGQIIAFECAKMGAHLFITGRNEERLNETFMGLEGNDHNQIVADLTTKDGLDAIQNAIPSLDGIVFCAGILDTTMLKFATSEHFNTVLNVNLIAPTILSQSLIKNKKFSKAASLVFISSIGSQHLSPGLGLYSASKAALNSIAKALAIELSNNKIRVNSILSATIKTNLQKQLTAITEEDWRKEEEKYPLGLGTPKDVAYACLYLLSDASRWITGTELKMDGGRYL